MIYHQLFKAATAERSVRAGIIGTGHFATAVVTQSQAIPLLEVAVVCDLNVAAAQRAYQLAGLSPEDYVVCDSRRAALQALESGKRVILSDARLMMDLPLDVVVESTGIPEASARHAAEAIHHGKHVAMVSKEVDVTVGPILKYRADRAEVIYTAVDGDQHGLLIGLVQWTRDLGLEVLCAGKSLEFDLVFDEAAGTVACHDDVVTLSEAERAAFRPGLPDQTKRQVEKRRAALGDFGTIAGYDVVEMVIAANATGLKPDVETLHCPILRIPEIPEVLAPTTEGGILARRGVIDSVICLRQPYEAGLGGGVFIVVACESDYSRHILTTKGLISNASGATALIYRPYHLCGVETPMSLLTAGLLKLPTGAIDYPPLYDVTARAAEDLKAGNTVGSDKSKSLQALIRPAQPATSTAPIPLHMANGNLLTSDAPAGTLLTVDMVKAPENSTLWALRAEQDKHFLA